VRRASDTPRYGRRAASGRYLHVLAGVESTPVSALGIRPNGTSGQGALCVTQKACGPRTARR
jgi:hypothetical protein